MAKAQCPNCGAEYDTGGIATICSRCLKSLPAPSAPGPVSATPTPPAPAPAAAPPPAPRPGVPPPAPAPAATTPSSQRRPCVKCGELLYPTEMTCWKCGSAQVERPGPAAAPPPGPSPYPPPPGAQPMPPILPPSPYAASTYVSGPSPEAQKRATTALILGVIGILCCNLLGPVALFMGLSARKEGAEGTATAAIVLGGISCALMVLGIVWAIVAFAMGMSGTPGGFTTP